MGIYNIDILKEVYFGETDEVVKLQSILSKFRARCFKENEFKKKENTYEEIEKFNRAVESMFGFSSFALHVTMDTYINAFTMPICSKLDVLGTKKNFAPTKKGLKYDKDAGYSCMVFITYELLMSQRFTDREILAIILHEIGHNFSEVINKTGTIFSNINKALMCVYTIQDIVIGLLNDEPGYIVGATTNVALSLNSVQKLVIKVKRIIKEKFPTHVIVNDTINRVSNVVLSYMNSFIQGFMLGKLILEPIRYLKLLFSIVIQYNPLNLLRSGFGYNEEKSSDTLPTLYGYGPDIASSLKKLDYPDYNEKKMIPLFSHFKGLMDLPIIILSSGMVYHPNTITRISEQVKYLEKELEGNVDSKIKKEIKGQIVSMNKIIDEGILKSAREKNIKDPDLINKLYVATMYDLCGGDIKELFIKNNNHKYIDDTFEAKIKQVKIK